MISDIQIPSIEPEEIRLSKIVAKIDEVLKSFSIDEIELLVAKIEVCVPKPH